MPAADIVNRLLLCATGIPMGIAIGVAFDHWRPMAAADAPASPAPISTRVSAEQDDLGLAVAEQTAQRRQLDRQLESLREELNRALSAREADGLSRPQREARKSDEDPLLADAAADLGLSLSADELLARRLAWRAEPEAPPALPAEAWSLIGRTPIGPLIEARLAALDDGATILATGRERLLLIDRELRTVRAEHPLPAAPTVWATDADGRELLVGTAGQHLLAWRVADGLRRGISACDGRILAVTAHGDGWAIATTAGIELRGPQLLLRSQLAWPTGEAPSAAAVTSDGLIALSPTACYRWRPERDTGPVAIPVELGAVGPSIVPAPDGRAVGWVQDGGTAILDLEPTDGDGVMRLADATFAGWSDSGMVLTASGQALTVRSPHDLQARALLQGAGTPCRRGGGLVAAAGDPWTIWDGERWLAVQGLRGGHAHPVDVIPDRADPISYHSDGQLWWWRREIAR